MHTSTIARLTFCVCLAMAEFGLIAADAFASGGEPSSLTATSTPSRKDAGTSTTAPRLGEAPLPSRKLAFTSTPSAPRQTVMSTPKDTVLLKLLGDPAFVPEMKMRFERAQQKVPELAVARVQLGVLARPAGRYSLYNHRTLDSGLSYSAPVRPALYVRGRLAAARGFGGELGVKYIPWTARPEASTEDVIGERVDLEALLAYQITFEDGVDPEEHQRRIAAEVSKTNLVDSSVEARNAQQKLWKLRKELNVCTDSEGIREAKACARVHAAIAGQLRFLGKYAAAHDAYDRARRLYHDVFRRDGALLREERHLAIYFDSLMDWASLEWREGNLEFALELYRSTAAEAATIQTLAQSLVRARGRQGDRLEQEARLLTTAAATLDATSRRMSGLVVTRRDVARRLQDDINSKDLRAQKRDLDMLVCRASQLLAEQRTERSSRGGTEVEQAVALALDVLSPLLESDFNVDPKVLTDSWNCTRQLLDDIQLANVANSTDHVTALARAGLASLQKAHEQLDTEIERRRKARLEVSRAGATVERQIGRLDRHRSDAILFASNLEEELDWNASHIRTQLPIGYAQVSTRPGAIVSRWSKGWKVIDYSFTGAPYLGFRYSRLATNSESAALATSWNITSLVIGAKLSFAWLPLGIATDLGGYFGLVTSYDDGPQSVGNNRLSLNVGSGESWRQLFLDHVWGLQLVQRVWLTDTVGLEVGLSYARQQVQTSGGGTLQTPEDVGALRDAKVVIQDADIRVGVVAAF